MQRKYGAYLVGSFQQPVDSSNLIDQGNICPECVQRGSGGLGEAGAVEWISIIQELDPACERGHDASMQGVFRSWKRWMRRLSLWQTGGPRPAHRSSAVAIPCYPWTVSIRFTQRKGLGTVHATLREDRSRITSCRDTVRSEPAGGIQGHCGRLKCWGTLRKGLKHLAPGPWEQWAAVLSSSANSARGPWAQVTRAMAPSSGRCLNYTRVTASDSSFENVISTLKLSHQWLKTW